MKEHKNVPEFTIIEDDAEMVENKFQYRIAKSMDDMEKQREKIIQKLSELKKTLDQLQLSIVQHKEKVKSKQTIQEQTVPVQEKIQIIVLGSETFPIT
jgi:hypothetical protein